MSEQDARNECMSFLLTGQKMSGSAKDIMVGVLKRQIPKKPVEKHYEEKGEKPYIKVCCPNGCNRQVNKFMNYCDGCGQKLDWGNE